MRWYFVAALLTVLASSQNDPSRWGLNLQNARSKKAFSVFFAFRLGILTTLSHSNGTYKYDYATVPVLAEAFKLAVSRLLLWKEIRACPTTRMTTYWKSMRLFSIPLVVYLVHNNVQFATLTYVDTPTYQIMGNLKIVTTGILFRIFLRRKLSNLRWMAIVLLAVGTTTSQHCRLRIVERLLATLCSLHQSKVICLVFYLLVYQHWLVSTEFLMKKNNDSLYWQNVQLYTFDVIFNLARLMADDFQSHFENGHWWKRFLNGYTLTTWMVVLNLGPASLLVSWLMKYADNIVKVYSTSMAMLLTMTLSIYLFHFKPTIQLFLGITICMMSLHMYFALPSLLVDTPATGKETQKNLREVSVERK